MINDRTMNTNSKFVITVNREFGSSGHKIGAILAEKLGVKMIDKEVLKATAEKFNVSEDVIDKIEKRRPSWWEDFAKFYESFVEVNEYYTGVSTEITSRQLFVIESNIIKDIAAEESCVVIGRSAFDIFCDTPNTLKVFLHADIGVRIKTIMQKFKIGEDDARKMIEDNDYQRELFTKTFTGKDRYDARNYDVCLDVGELGVEETVKTILDLIKI